MTQMSLKNTPLKFLTISGYDEVRIYSRKQGLFLVSLTTILLISQPHTCELKSRGGDQTVCLIRFFSL